MLYRIVEHSKASGSSLTHGPYSAVEAARVVGNLDTPESDLKIIDEFGEEISAAKLRSLAPLAE